MDPCSEHAAFDEKFGGMDKRLCSAQDDIKTLTEVSVRQVTLMEEQQKTNERLEESQKEMTRQFDERIGVLEQKPSRYFDLAVGAGIAGIVGWILMSLGIGS